MKSTLFSDDYALNSMFSGVGEALLLAVQYLIATVGAASVGLWVAGLTEVHIIFSILALVWGVFYSYTSFILGLIGLVGMVVSWKSYQYRLDGLFVMFVCNVLIAFKSSSVYSLPPYGLRLAAALLLPLALYLFLRIPLWLFLVQQRRESREMEEDEEEFKPNFVLCPECNARLWLDESGDAPESCALCGHELISGEADSVEAIDQNNTN